MTAGAKVARFAIFSDEGFLGPFFFCQKGGGGGGGECQDPKVAG